MGTCWHSGSGPDAGADNAGAGDADAGGGIADAGGGDADAGGGNADAGGGNADAGAGTVMLEPLGGEGQRHRRRVLQVGHHHSRDTGQAHQQPLASCYEKG